MNLGAGGLLTLRRGPCPTLRMPNLALMAPALGRVPDEASMAEEPHEVEWVRAAKAGDAAAFQRLYRRYWAVVRSIVLAHVGWQEADDISQDVFLTAWQRLGQLQDPARFPAWLATCARNRCHNHHRAKPTRVAMPERGAPMPPVSEAREVLRAIQALSPAYRETLVMRLVEGMSGPEIAQKTGLTPRSVRVNLHRGMTKLKAILEEGGA